MTTPPPNPAPATPSDSSPRKILPGWRRWLLTLLAILLLLAFMAGALVYVFGYTLVQTFVQSPAGQRIVSQSVGHAVKVDGQFAPLHLDGWTVRTDSFTSTGWPGEAIGGLNAYGIRAEFDPEAIWRGVYHIKGIQIDRGVFVLRTPNDALKRPVPPKKPKPCYAHFLPSVFECGPIRSPDANVDFEFQKQEGHIQHAALQADLIGRDFRYTATSGTLIFPYLPALHIDRLVVMVTRPMLTFEDVELSGLNSNDPTRMVLRGNMGQREDKTVNALVEIVAMPIEQVMPPALASMVHGRATGHLIWKRDQTGHDVVSEGELDLAGASISDLSVFKQLSLLHGNPDLLNFTFDTLHLKFHLKNGHFVADLVAVAAGKFSLTGTATYEQDSKELSLELNFKDLPLKTWLPPEFKPRYSGVATASLQWRGQPDTFKNSTGALSINLDGTHIHNPVLLQRMLRKTKLRAPDELDFKTAQLDFTYQDQTFQLTRAQLDVPGVITVGATGTLVEPDNTLDATMTWSGLTLGNWLPPEMARDISGDINGGVKVHVQKWKLKDGAYAGNIQLLNGELRYLSVQSMLARFVNDRRLLELPLTRATFSWTWNHGALAVSNIDLRADETLGVQGDLALTKSGKLSGLLWVGTKPVYLRSLMGLGDAVFFRNADGLRWARVTASGTAKEPKQDLSSQIMGQLHKHPLAFLSLSGKLISWYVGDWFGAEDEWKRPK